MTTEAIIKAVKDNPILYDTDHHDYRNIKKRDKTWEDIGKKLRLHGEEVKKRWKNLRDTYCKYVKTIKCYDGTDGKKLCKPWQWARKMEQFDPYFSFTKDSENSYKDYLDQMFENDIDNSSQSFNDYTQDNPEESENQETAQSEENNEPPTKKRKYGINVVDKVMQFLEAKVMTPEMDATDMLFLGYSKTLKSFSYRRQAETKMKIAQIFLEEELNHIDEIQNPQMGSDSNLTITNVDSLNSDHMEFVETIIKKEQMRDEEQT